MVQNVIIILSNYGCDVYFDWCLFHVYIMNWWPWWQSLVDTMMFFFWRHSILHFMHYNIMHYKTMCEWIRVVLKIRQIRIIDRQFTHILGYQKKLSSSAIIWYQIAIVNGSWWTGLSGSINVFEILCYAAVIAIISFNKISKE